MNRPASSPPLPPLPYRARPPQVLLGVGAVLLVSGGAAVAGAYGGSPVRALLLGLSTAAAAGSVRAAHSRLRSSEEILAASAVGLGLAGVHVGGLPPAGNPVPPLVLAALCLALSPVARTTAAWPLAAWTLGQWAVLQSLDDLPAGARAEVPLSVTLLGLGIALSGRRIVARAALVTTGPWWVAGVVLGLHSAWSGDGAQRWVAAVLLVTVAGLLLLTRLRRRLDPLLGPPMVVPVVAGVVAGAAVAGALSSLGTWPITLTGYAGVLVATTAAAALTGWRRGLLLPVALAGGATMTVLSVLQLAAAADWSALSLLLLLTAVPTVLVALLRPEDRPVAVPTAVGCLAGSALLALPAGVLTRPTVAMLLTGLYAVALVLGSAFRPEVRRRTAGAAAASGAAAVLLSLAGGDRGVLAVHLAVQGLVALGWAVRTHREDAPGTADDAATAAWMLGAAQLVASAWTAGATAGLATVEAYTLPAAAGLLLGAGPRLAHGSSWRAWGPCLLVAAVPSTVLAVVEPGSARPVAVLVVAAAVMVAGGRSGLRAPLLVGAGSALAVPLDLAVRALPWPIGAALLVGCALLAVGTVREGRPVAGFGARLADLR